MVDTNGIVFGSRIWMHEKNSSQYKARLARLFEANSSIKGAAKLTYEHIVTIIRLYIVSLLFKHLNQKISRL